MTANDTCPALLRRHAGERLPLIAASFSRLTGRSLCPAANDPADALWSLPRVILAHGTEPDPVFFFGNRMALELFDMSAQDFIALPSRLSAEPLLREERARLLERVARDGFIDDYSGIRVSATGRRFRIEQAIVWNLIDEAGIAQGQAATFDRWIRLD